MRSHECSPGTVLKMDSSRSAPTALLTTTYSLVVGCTPASPLDRGDQVWGLGVVAEGVGGSRGSAGDLRGRGLGERAGPSESGGECVCMAGEAKAAAAAAAPAALWW